MAYHANSSSNRLTNSRSSVSGITSLSFACWVYRDGTNSPYFYIEDSETYEGMIVWIYFSVSGMTSECWTGWDDGTGAERRHTGTFTPGWAFIGARAKVESGVAYFDSWFNTTKQSSSGAVQYLPGNVSDVAQTYICSDSGVGDFAEVVIGFNEFWDDKIFEQLAKGFSPLCLRKNWLNYFPLLKDIRDFGTTPVVLTEEGSSVWSSHPRLILPRRQFS